MKKHIITFTLALIAGVLSYTTSFAQNGANTAPPDEFKPSGKLSMQFFGDYYYQIGASDTIAKRGKQYYSGNSHYFQAFDIRRVYLGYDYNFTKDVSAGLLLSHENGALGTSSAVTSAKYDSTKKTLTTTSSSFPTNSSGDIVLDGNRGLYLKNANIRWKNVIPYSTLIFGQQGTAAFALTEQLWSYRSIEKTLMDARGLAQSNDLGIQLTGGIDANSTVGYSVMISNGNGAKAENDKYKKFAGEVNTKFLENHIILEVYADHMDLNQLSGQTTLKGMAAVNYDVITAGVEYAMQTITTTGADDQTPNGLSIFAHGYLVPKMLNWFARYDMYNPNSKITTTGYKENFITAGLDWLPTMDANVHVMPNIWVNTYGEQGSSPKIDADLVGRVTFFCKF